MSTSFDAYAGFADETTYGTAATVDHFHEFTKEGLAGKYERIESAALRAGSKVLRADRFVPNPKGAEGDFEFEVENQGLAFWLKYMVGPATQSGTAPAFTYKAGVGDLNGKSFTAQIGRVGRSGTLDPYTYEGGKVTSWELSNSVDGLLMLTLNMDFAHEVVPDGTQTGAFAAQTPTFPDDAVLLSYIGGTITIGGVTFKASEVSVKGDNGLKTDSYYIGTTDKREPLESDQRKYDVTFKGDYEDSSMAKRVASVAAAGALATAKFEWATPDGQHKVTIDIPALRFDESKVNVDGPGFPEQNVTAVGLAPTDGTSPLTITVVTPDAAA